MNSSQKTIVITGSNSGIGKEAAVLLAQNRHTVVMMSREGEKSKQALQDIRERSGRSDVSYVPVDLAAPRSIREAAKAVLERHPVVDALVNNAGIYHIKRKETPEGIEESFAVNFLAPFMLSRLLLKSVESGRVGRIVNVVSELYKKGRIDIDDPMMRKLYSGRKAYANAKLACVLDTRVLALRLKNRGVTVNALHPGLAGSEMFREYPHVVVRILNLFLEDVKKGGGWITHLAESKEMENISGRYIYKTETREIEVSDRDAAASAELFSLAEKLTGVSAE
jgi:retinol dehydrogenase-14